MKKEHVLTYALVVVVAATSAMGSRVHVVDLGDTNGDREVDVLDLQTVVAQVLSASSAKVCADVNCDGRIDILDLQWILAHATQADSPMKESPAESKGEATAPAIRDVPTPLIVSVRLVPELGARDRRGPANWTKRDRFAAIPTHTERYLFTLTPHAPPRCA